MRLNEIFLYEILTQIKKVLVAGKVDLNLMVPCQNNYLNEKATFIHLAESSRAANVCGVSSQALQTSSVRSTLGALMFAQYLK
jgi:hypothetical protein